MQDHPIANAERLANEFESWADDMTRRIEAVRAAVVALRGMVPPPVEARQVKAPVKRGRPKGTTGRPTRAYTDDMLDRAAAIVTAGGTYRDAAEAVGVNYNSHFRKRVGWHQGHQREPVAPSTEEARLRVVTGRTALRPRDLDNADLVYSTEAPASETNGSDR